MTNCRTALIAEPIIAGHFHITCNMLLLAGRLQRHEVALIAESSHANIISELIGRFYSGKPFCKLTTLRFFHLSLPHNTILASIITSLQLILNYLRLIFAPIFRKYNSLYCLSCDYTIFPIVCLLLRYLYPEISVVIHKPYMIERSLHKLFLWSFLLRTTNNIVLIALSDKGLSQLNNSFPSAQSSIKYYYPHHLWPFSGTQLRSPSQLAYLPQRVFNKVATNNFEISDEYIHQFKWDTANKTLYLTTHNSADIPCLPQKTFSNHFDYIAILSKCTHMIVSTSDEGLAFSGYRLDAISARLQIIEIP